MEDPSTSREALCWPYDERGMRERGMIALVLSRSLDGHRDTNQTGGCTLPTTTEENCDRVEKQIVGGNAESSTICRLLAGISEPVVFEYPYGEMG